MFYRLDRQYLFIRYTDSEDVVIADVYLYDRLLYIVTEPSVNAFNSKVATKAEATILV